MKPVKLSYTLALILTLLASSLPALGEEQETTQPQTAVPAATVTAPSLTATPAPLAFTPSSLSATSRTFTAAHHPLALPAARIPQLAMPVRVHVPLPFRLYVPPQPIQPTNTIQLTSATFAYPQTALAAHRNFSLPPALTTMTDFDPVSTVAQELGTSAYFSALSTPLGPTLGLGSTVIQGIGQFNRTADIIGAATQMISPLPPGTEILFGQDTITTTTLRRVIDPAQGLTYTRRFGQTMSANFIEQALLRRYPAFLFDPTRPFWSTLEVHRFSPPPGSNPQSWTHYTP